MVIITFSESAPVSTSIYPCLLKVYPIIPINTATAIEITTQIVAILLESFILFSSLIAIKRKSTCGIPKYPSPHASVDAILIEP